jgi:sulfate transport system permease protein
MVQASWRRWLLLGIVGTYIAVLVLAPLAALVAGALADGPGAAWRALWEPDFLHALRLTIAIGAITVLIHAVFGTVVAWVLVRDRFRGQSLANALIDMPFAVSPVVVGYMVFLLFGRTGVLAPIVQAWFASSCPSWPPWVPNRNKPLPPSAPGPG